jgi:hypothetical protein
MYIFGLVFILCGYSAFSCALVVYVDLDFEFECGVWILNLSVDFECELGFWLWAWILSVGLDFECGLGF